MILHHVFIRCSVILHLVFCITYPVILHHVLSICVQWFYILFCALVSYDFASCLVCYISSDFTSCLVISHHNLCITYLVILHRVLWFCIMTCVLSVLVCCSMSCDVCVLSLYSHNKHMTNNFRKTDKITSEIQLSVIRKICCVLFYRKKNIIFTRMYFFFCEKSAI